MIEQPPSSSEASLQSEISARNGHLRHALEEPIDHVVTYLDENFPGLQPNHLTLAGLGLVLSADILIRKFPEHPVPITAIYSVGSAFDALDGALQRKKNEKTGQSSTTKGMKQDVRADRLQEIATACALSGTAGQIRGNKFATKSYGLAVMTAVLPAWARSTAEKRGIVVEEGGLGTRIGRAVLGGVGIAFNKNRAISDAVSATLVIGNVVTAVKRRNVITQTERSSSYRGTNDSPEFTNAARVREKTLHRLAIVGFIAGATVLLKKSKSKSESDVGFSGKAESGTRS